MSAKTIVSCGAQSPGQVDGEASILPLDLWGVGAQPANVRLRIQSLREHFYDTVPERFLDLLEIATYVNCADHATSRGKMDVDGFGEQWRRSFEFHVPVRVPEFWNSEPVKNVLRSTLQFLSDDSFNFTFYGTTKAPRQWYFAQLFPDEPGGEPDGVVMFSGGLDSLAGAIEESVNQKRRPLLVNHRSTQKLNNIHRRLASLLQEKAGGFQPIHLPVVINKSKALNREYTQRTRSFLYVSLGATVAKMLGQRSVRFYENGVVSMNLPVSAQVIGSRATRTTHPQTLAGFQDLLSLVAGEAFTVENPFLWDTKADVVRRIVKAGCGELIGASVSCAHTWLFTNQHTHCGTCSQCIDRRFGVLAAGAEAFESAASYKTDVFTGSRPKGEDRTMIANYLERANRVQELRDVADLIKGYPEVVRVLRHLPGKATAMAARTLALHKQHRSEVAGVVEQMLQRHVQDIRTRTLPQDCLLRMVYDSGSRSAAPAPLTETKFQEQQAARLESQKASPNTYQLRRGHKIWELVFQGEREVLLSERAVDLVEYLLKHPPDEPIHATELENCVDGSPVMDGSHGGLGEGQSNGGNGIGGVVQEGTGKKFMGGMGTILKSKIRELQRDMEDPTLHETERTQARAELDELLVANGRGGKIKSGATQSAERVRKAIRRFITELKATETTKGKPNTVFRGFGEH